MYADDVDNICEGCGTRNTGANFEHEALCKSCMAQIMGTNDVLKGKGSLNSELLKNADTKSGALTTWKDTDGLEVELVLPLPQGVTKRQLQVKTTATTLLVTAGERQLLRVDPLYDEVLPHDTLWCLEPADDGSAVNISLTKSHEGTRWGKTLAKEGGTFECWCSLGGSGSGGGGSDPSHPKACLLYTSPSPRDS